MTTVTYEPDAYDPDAWIRDIEQTCTACGTRWKLSMLDKPASFWRWFTGILPKPRTVVMGPGIVTTSTYIVKDYPAETGFPGTHLTTRCPHCGAYHLERKR
jgi:hypothetical protein